MYSDKYTDICTKCIYGIDYNNATDEELLAQIKLVFDKYVIKNDDYCWGWSGLISNKGYSSINIRGAKTGAHRASWMIHNGHIPDGIFVCHRCNNRSCTNPNHLFLGTHQDNMDDMIKKGRTKILRGEDCPWTNLDNKTVSRIKADLKKNIPNKYIIKIYGISKGVLDKIKSGKSWRHVK